MILRRLTLTAAAGAFALALVGCSSGSDAAAPTTAPEPSVSPSAAAPSASAAPSSSPSDDADDDDGDDFTFAEVQQNNTPESCWTVIDDDVYDLTAWIPQHPGGAEAIEQLCGTDGTAIFEGQHGGQQQQEDTLEQYKIGDLEG